MTTRGGSRHCDTFKMTIFKITRFPKYLQAVLTGLAFAMFSVAACAQEQGATALKDLENFVKNTKSGRAAFTQVVTSPAKEGQTPKVKTSSGTFEFLRPNRFKFLYKKTV